ncbi:MAG: hypothetical protein ACLVIY_05635 [Anaerobutyricum soehngenii]
MQVKRQRICLIELDGAYQICTKIEKRMERCEKLVESAEKKLFTY